jgi:glyoxylase-like metal-dependent hydrolase (beta-lactamase superfamily II)
MEKIDFSFPAVLIRFGFVLAVAVVLGLISSTLRFAEATPIQPAPLPSPIAKSVAEGVWMIPGGFLPNRQPDGNTIIFRGSKGLVVMDTGRHVWQRQAILDFAKSQKSPIVAIINSHWHLDHISGNPDLKTAYPKAKVYASDAITGALVGFLKNSAADAKAYLETAGVPPESAEDIRNDLATIANGDALKPDVVVDKSQKLMIGGRKLQVNFAPFGTTDGDLWVYDPKSKIAAVGDLVTFPAPFLDTACTKGWIKAMDQVLASPFETAIPGHGLPMTRDQFTLYRNAFVSFVDCAKSDRAAMVCAEDWARDTAKLLALNNIDPELAKGFAGYYVKEVLRPNGGNSKFCNKKD